MRESWNIVPLGELCGIELGKTPARGSLRLWDRDRATKNVWLSIADLPQRTQAVVCDSKEYISDEGAANCKIVKEGTLLVSFKLTLGRLAFAGRDLYTNEAIVALTIHDKTKLSSDYLYWYLTFFDWHKAAEGHHKIKGKTLNKAKLKILDVLVPSLPEQKRIVAILDEAFQGIDKVIANTEKNLANARELYQVALKTCFDQQQTEPHGLSLTKLSIAIEEAISANLSSSAVLKASSTRGRAATDGIIKGDFSLSVGIPSDQPRSGWTWSKLTDIARLESGHTPSRLHPEYWTGEIPWMGIKDAKAHHGKMIYDTKQHTNQIGLDNSAARLLPKNTVCLSRTASVGYVVVMRTEMATSQDFVNWVCGSQLDPHFLQYLFLAEDRDFSKFSSGAVHQTIYFPEVKAFHICHPNIGVQSRIVEFLNKVRSQTEQLENLFKRKTSALAELKQSILQKAFNGELTAEPETNTKQGDLCIT